MTGTGTVVGASMLAHGIHIVIVLLGLWALAALLLPQLIERRAASASRARVDRRQVSYGAGPDAHASRVHELRSAASSGTLARRRPDDARHPQPVTSGPPPPRPAPVLGLPLALVAGATAAGIHAAVAPAHLVEEPLFGVFFLLVAGAQLWWVAALVSRPEAVTLRVGIALHGALIVLWVITRLVGLPFGLLPQPHPLGAWDVTCALWETLCIVSSVRVLRGVSPSRVSGWSDWHPSTRAAVGAASVLMVLLVVVGAHS